MDVVRDEGSTNSSCQVGSDKPADEAPAMVASGGAMVDSGAGKHLTGKRQCSKEELEHAAPADVVLITAKGEQHVDKQVEMHLDALNIDVQALALDDCPNVASLGRLVIEHGYTFSWSPNGKGQGRSLAELISPCGTRVELNVRGFVPYLPEQGLKEVKGKPAQSKAKRRRKKGSNTAAPATESGSSSSSSGAAVEGSPPVTGDSAIEPSVPSVPLFQQSSRSARQRNSVCVRWQNH